MKFLKPIKKAVKSVKNFPYRLRVYNKNFKRLDQRKKDYWLINVDGTELKPINVDKNGDMQKLQYKDDNGKKTCAITSKPMFLKGRELYFTRDGFKGTMAINKDTLLDTDVYKLVDKDDDGYNGDITSLKGSKEVLRELNKGTRLKKLLQQSSFPVHMVMAYIGVGVAIGIIVSQYFM